MSFRSTLLDIGPFLPLRCVRFRLGLVCICSFRGTSVLKAQYYQVDLKQEPRLGDGLASLFSRFGHLSTNEEVAFLDAHATEGLWKISHSRREILTMVELSAQLIWRILTWDPPNRAPIGRRKVVSTKHVHIVRKECSYNTFRRCMDVSVQSSRSTILLVLSRSLHLLSVTVHCYSRTGGQQPFVEIVRRDVDICSAFFIERVRLKNKVIPRDIQKVIK